LFFSLRVSFFALSSVANAYEEVLHFLYKYYFVFSLFSFSKPSVVLFSLGFMTGTWHLTNFRTVTWKAWILLAWPFPDHDP